MTSFITAVASRSSSSVASTLICERGKAAYHAAKLDA